VFVVESTGSGIVGFASYGPNRDAAPQDIGELYSIYLLQAWQGQGLGNELVRYVAGELRRQGFRQMRAWAFPPAHGFYLRMGGTRIAERPLTIEATTLVESCFQWAIRDA
jgi:GNAT superfamily N-acetyltransferase